MHDKIYLINTGGEISWCDDPTPAPNMDKKDAVEYVKADQIPTEAIKDALEGNYFDREVMEKFLAMVER